MMKRFLVLVLVLMLALPLAACSNSGDASAEKVLRVGMECAYAPYNWAQSDDTNGAVAIVDSNQYAYGYDVMMAKYVADKMGMTLEIYQMDWDSLPVAVQSGKIDCAIAGQSITAERLESMDFSTPYYYATIVGLTRNDTEYADAKGISDLKGVTATSQINTVWYNDCLPQIEDANILPAMETAPAMLVALNSGKTDLVVTDMPTAKAACYAYPNLVLLDFAGSGDDFDVPQELINIGISVKKGNSELLTKLNEALSNLTTDDFTRMMNEAIAAQPLTN